MSAQTSNATFLNVRRLLGEVNELKDALRALKPEIIRFEGEAGHTVYGPSAKRRLAELYDREVLLSRRVKSLEKNIAGYQLALARGPGDGSDSSKSSRASSRSSRSGKSNKSSGSSESASRPAENGWWCRCGVLNYTEPDEQVPCWGCQAQVFDDRCCAWQIEPHPDSVSPWEIDMRDPRRDASNRGIRFLRR
ncbi:uncharacterized protein LMH87_008323 [Akanthomyces muscarius]|uniref:Uncharacterized protein n=1 Tax=Akanthomyces muscarius TaxID=2231603 RepID=A0A9W8UQR9_AKAMU|nr:uncharacterized protein LMH87_008323 [Akanthomyces muscarius]KAJ4159421.1 hypothetical protein LMH87_008323 [Akanthomyces muscarius]